MEPSHPPGSPDGIDTTTLQVVLETVVWRQRQDLLSLWGSGRSDGSIYIAESGTIASAV
ncbi:MAG: hypothetical protein HS132_10190 [Planctomycetia bacterium]|nr:hypothetical protein [Planctomycetia bacterium]